MSRGGDPERLDDTLDRVLAGLVIRADDAAQEITEEWCATARWREVVRVLCRHRARGGRLGDIIAAGEVLDEAHIPLPRTTAAEAVLAADEAGPPVWVGARARERLVRLTLRRLARSFESVSRADLDVIPRNLERLDAILIRVLRDLCARVAA